MAHLHLWPPPHDLIKLYSIWIAPELLEPSARCKGKEGGLRVNVNGLKPLEMLES